MDTLTDIHDPAGLLPQVAATPLPGDLSRMPDSEAILQGYLKKDNGKQIPAWKRRWFVLYKDRLEWTVKADGDATSINGQKPVTGNSVNILDIDEIIPDLPGLGVPNAFKLSTPGRCLLLQAPLEGARRHWLTAIAASILHARHQAEHARAAAARSRAREPQEPPEDEVLTSRTTGSFDPSLADLAGMPLEDLPVGHGGGGPTDGAQEDRLEGMEGSRYPYTPHADSARPGDGIVDPAAAALTAVLQAAEAMMQGAGRGTRAGSRTEQPATTQAQGSIEELLELQARLQAVAAKAEAVAAVQEASEAGSTHTPSSSAFNLPPPAPPSRSVSRGRSNVDGSVSKAPSRATSAVRSRASSVSSSKKGGSALPPPSSSKPPVPRQEGTARAKVAGTGGTASTTASRSNSVASSTAGSGAWPGPASSSIVGIEGGEDEHAGGEGRQDGAGRPPRAAVNHAPAASRVEVSKTMMRSGRANSAPPSPPSRQEARDRERDRAGSCASAAGVMACTPSRNRIEYAKAWVNACRLAAYEQALVSQGLSVAGALPPTPLPVHGPGHASKRHSKQHLATEFATGMLLVNVLEQALPSMKVDGVARRPRARPAFLTNNEAALRCIWKAGVKGGKMPGAEELADGTIKEDKLAAFMIEVYEAVALRPVRAPGHSLPALRWLEGIVRSYGMGHVGSAGSSAPLPTGLQLALCVDGEHAASRPEHVRWHGLWSFLRSGVALACVCHWYAGDAAQDREGPVGEGEGGRVAQGMDLGQVFVGQHALSRAQRRSNLQLALGTLSTLGCKVVVTPDLMLGAAPTAAAPPCDYSEEDEDDDVALLQVCLAYDHLHALPCALPSLPWSGPIFSAHSAQLRRAAEEGTPSAAALACIREGSEHGGWNAQFDDSITAVVGCSFADAPAPWRKRKEGSPQRGSPSPARGTGHGQAAADRPPTDSQGRTPAVPAMSHIHEELPPVPPSPSPSPPITMTDILTERASLYALAAERGRRTAGTGGGGGKVGLDPAVVHRVALVWANKKVLDWVSSSGRPCEPGAPQVQALLLDPALHPEMHTEAVLPPPPQVLDAWASRPMVHTPTPPTSPVPPSLSLLAAETRPPQLAQQAEGQPVQQGRIPVDVTEGVQGLPMEVSAPATPVQYDRMGEATRGGVGQVSQPTAMSYTHASPAGLHSSPLQGGPSEQRYAMESDSPAHSPTGTNAATVASREGSPEKSDQDEYAALLGTTLPVGAAPLVTVPGVAAGTAQSRSPAGTRVQHPTSPFSPEAMAPPMPYVLTRALPADSASRAAWVDAHRAGMGREERWSWERHRREALEEGREARIPLRGGLYSISSKTQPTALVPPGVLPAATAMAARSSGADTGQHLHTAPVPQPEPILDAMAGTPATASRQAPAGQQVTPAVQTTGAQATPAQGAFSSSHAVSPPAPAHAPPSANLSLPAQLFAVKLRSGNRPCAVQVSMVSGCPCCVWGHPAMQEGGKLGVARMEGWVDLKNISTVRVGEPAGGWTARLAMGNMQASKDSGGLLQIEVSARPGSGAAGEGACAAFGNALAEMVQRLQAGRRA